MKDSRKNKNLNLNIICLTKNHRYNPSLMEMEGSSGKARFGTPLNLLIFRILRSSSKKLNPLKSKIDKCSLNNAIIKS